MWDPTDVVIILMPSKLLQAEQNAMINKIPQGKAIALTGENNQQKTQQSITRKAYTHIFTSPEIALSKKFKLNVSVMSWSHVTSHVMGLTRSGQFQDQYWSRTPRLT